MIDSSGLRIIAFDPWMDELALWRTEHGSHLVGWLLRSSVSSCSHGCDQGRSTQSPSPNRQLHIPTYPINSSRSGCVHLAFPSINPSTPKTPTKVPTPSEIDQALFTSKIFEGMRGDYFVFRNFPGRLFTSPGFEEIISEYPHKSSLL
jgi:hypothetical protein